MNKKSVKSKLLICGVCESVIHTVCKYGAEIAESELARPILDDLAKFFLCASCEPLQTSLGVSKLIGSLTEVGKKVDALTETVAEFKAEDNASIVSSDFDTADESESAVAGTSGFQKVKRKKKRSGKVRANAEVFREVLAEQESQKQQVEKELRRRRCAVVTMLPNDDLSVNSPASLFESIDNLCQITGAQGFRSCHRMG